MFSFCGWSSGSSVFAFLKLDEALAQLSPEHRTVLVLREYEGLSYQEIADALGCRIGTVMSRLHYARRRARELLGDLL